jgi:DNA polymerase
VQIIGEAPGQEEERLGMPFVGRSGKLLDDIFTYAGFDMNKHVYVANVAKRRPPNNRNPTKEEIAYYLPLLWEEIRLVNPSIIILAGAIALKAVLNLSGIAKMRGQWLYPEVEGSARCVMPVYHPSFLLRDPRKKYDMKVRHLRPSCAALSSFGMPADATVRRFVSTVRNCIVLAVRRRPCDFYC